MAKSFMAHLASGLLRIQKKYTETEYEERVQKKMAVPETPSALPKGLAARYEDSPDGRMFYLNEKDSSPIVFYLHGGAYFVDYSVFHWRFIKKLIRRTNAMVITPGYRLAPYATYKEAFDLIRPVYEKHAAQNREIILMGDSAGAGLAAALAEDFIKEGIRYPDELILMSPWVDVSMDNPEIHAFEKKDPWLTVSSLRVLGRYWAGDLDVHDPKVSPIYGDYHDLHNVTVFVGTQEIFYPDVLKFYDGLSRDGNNELIIGKGMNHVYPLFPIPEAKDAVDGICKKILR